MCPHQQPLYKINKREENQWGEDVSAFHLGTWWHLGGSATGISPAAVRTVLTLSFLSNLKHTKKIQWEVSFFTQSQDLPYAEQSHHHSHELLSHTSTTDTGKHSHIESRAGEYEHCTRSLYLNLRKNALTVLWYNKETDNKKEESLTHGL